jgi:nicotinamidase/pyrazinamidase
MSTVFFDIDTQHDFLIPGGALYVDGAEAIIDNVAKLNHYAADHGIPLISTTDAHTPDDPEFAQYGYPPHCVAGTPGALKPRETLVDGQIVVQKQTLNCFDVPALSALLDEIRPTQAIVYGVVTEICVKHAAMGLLARGIPVAIVTDAVKELNPANAQGFLREFQQAGGTLRKVAEVVR